MKYLPGKFKPILFNLANLPCLSMLIVSLAIAGCDNQRETSNNSSLESGVSLQTPDSMLGYRLDRTAGTLTAAISGCSATSPMTIGLDTATAACTGVPTGSRTINITFTYNRAQYGPLIVATASKTINVTEGNNLLTFVATDYDTASYDEDGDGISNIRELDENSTSNPLVALCVLGATQLDDCEMGS